VSGEENLVSNLFSSFVTSHCIYHSVMKCCVSS